MTRQIAGSDGGTALVERTSGIGLAIEHRPVEALIPYARNPPTHSEE